MTGAEWPAGVGLRIHDSLDSTNAEAARLAGAGEPGPLWILARTQTAGRGRRGRGWVSPPGNLMATLLLRPQRPPGEAAQLSFLAALAVADLLDPELARGALALKWPNDVLVAGRKIAGILLESAAGAEGRLAWLAVGIGVNLAHHPQDPDLAYPATSLPAATGRSLAPEDALTRLAAAFAGRQALWEGQGFAPVRAAWLARAAGLGQPITVRLPGETLSGGFAGLSPDGALLLAEPGGLTRKVAAGEVFFAPPAR